MEKRTVGCMLLLGLLTAAACGDDTDADAGSDGGRDSRGDAASGDAAMSGDAANGGNAGRGGVDDAGDVPDGDEADGGIVLECPRGAKVSRVHVAFDCSEITVYTCKDLSNVVVEYEDGTRQRFEGLTGHVNAFAGTGANAGKRVVRVWVKAGNNASGDGPGYGERVEAPAQSCTPPSGGRGGSGGAGGTGGIGGTGGAAGDPGPA